MSGPDRWEELSDSQGAFSYEWVEQCADSETWFGDIADVPLSSQDMHADSAIICLHVGVWRWEKVPKTIDVKIGSWTLRCETFTENRGAWVDADEDGPEECAADVHVIIRCREVRAVLKRPRKRRAS